MNHIEELVQRFVMVWNETDPSRRGEEVRNLWRIDGRHLMGANDTRGHDALEQRVAASRGAPHNLRLPFCGILNREVSRWEIPFHDAPEIK
jgi:hypothetical protein